MEGVVTGMFLLGGSAGSQDEIDVEVFGKKAVEPGTWEVQTNYYVKGSQGNCGEPYGIPEPCHVSVIPIDFNPTESYHIYNISWIGEGENCPKKGIRNNASQEGNSIGCSAAKGAQRNFII